MDKTAAGIGENLNYIRLRSFLPLFCRYIYLDTGEYLSDRIFAEKGLWVSTGIELIHESNGYRIIFCRIFRWQKKKFLQAMEELSRRMPLMGHPDYDSACREFSRVPVKKK